MREPAWIKQCVRSVHARRTPGEAHRLADVVLRLLSPEEQHAPADLAALALLYLFALEQEREDLLEQLAPDCYWGQGCVVAPWQCSACQHRLPGGIP